MWLLMLSMEIVAIELLQPVELGFRPAEITLIAPDDVDLLRQVSSIAADPARNLVLRLHSVETVAEPTVSWEVYVASSDAADCDNVPALAGIISSYGALPVAEFVLPLDSAVVAGNPRGLKVIFKPVSGLEESREADSSGDGALLLIGAASVEAEVGEAR